jgi:hypothetical protein
MPALFAPYRKDDLEDHPNLHVDLPGIEGSVRDCAEGAAGPETWNQTRAGIVDQVGVAKATGIASV